VPAHAKTTEEPFDVAALLAQFQENESTKTGTVVIHHGKVKQPWVALLDFSHVLLTPVAEDPRAALAELARQALARFDLNQVLVVHRLGRVEPGGDVLFVAVSAATRKPAFEACAWLVDAVKEEGAVRLTEQP